MPQEEFYAFMSADFNIDLLTDILSEIDFKNYFLVRVSSLVMSPLTQDAQEK